MTATVTAILHALTRRDIARPLAEHLHDKRDIITGALRTRAAGE